MPVVVFSAGAPAARCGCLEAERAVVRARDVMLASARAPRAGGPLGARFDAAAHQEDPTAGAAGSSEQGSGEAQPSGGGSGFSWHTPISRIV